MLIKIKCLPKRMSEIDNAMNVYPANDIFELVEHIYEFHILKKHGKFVCTFCDAKFGSKDDMMLHQKIFHKGRVS